MFDESLVNPARYKARVKRGEASRASRHCGFTLVELVATMVVLGTLATIAGGIVQRLAQVQTTAAIRAQLYADANLAMERIVMMIKHTPPRAGVSQTPALLYLDADDIVWENNDELDFVAASGGNPGRLMLRSVRDGDPSAGGQFVLLEHVSGISFQFLDDQERNIMTLLGVNELDTPAETSTVHAVNVQIDMARAGVTATLRTRVLLRANAELTTP